MEESKRDAIQALYGYILYQQPVYYEMMPMMADGAGIPEGAVQK